MNAVGTNTGHLLVAVMAIVIGVLVPTTAGATAEAGDPGDEIQGDPCDPESYPDWASDSLCNPVLTDVQSTTTPPQPEATERLSPALDAGSIEEVPLIDLDPDEAPTIGAGRMLLAIDAIAELGGFERATTPGNTALLRDIRETIPAAGLDEDGYTVELELFVSDFIPFLEALEAEGVVVSDDLWQAAESLDAVVHADIDSAEATDAETGLLSPTPWILGLADLLVRGGEPGLIPTPSSDESEIRELLSTFAEIPVEATPTADVSPQTAPSIALALEANAEAEAPESDAIPLGLIGAGVALILAAFVAFLPSRRRPKQRNARGDSVLHPERSDMTPSPSQSANAGAGTSKASVTELLDASRRMSASLDAVAIASIALTEAKRIVGAEGGIVVRRTEDGLDPVGCEPPMLFNYQHIADGCLPRVIETGRSVAAIAHDEPLLVEVPMAMGAVPIVAEGLTIGAILVVRGSARPFDRDELDGLEMLAPLIGSAFAVAEQHETATELVDVEPLTGLHNRRRLDVDLASISTDDEVAYVMVDIDHFKNFNDTNGHAAGDEALRQVSAVLQDAVRPNDLVYRYGGEEFCVLLPGTSAADAAVVAERARAAVEAAIIPGMENQPAGVVTISVGVSDSAFGTPGDLVERADAALYSSKRNGRNQVTVSTAE